MSRAIEALASEAGGLTVAEFSKRFRTSKASAYRLLSMLADVGLVERDHRTQRFTLGPHLFAIGMRAVRSRQIQEAALLPMVQMVRAFGLPVSLNLRHGRQILVLFKVEQLADDLILASPQGQEVPFHATAAGKAILAFYPLETFLDLAKGQLQAFTPNTVTSHEAFLKELEETKQKGYACYRAEFGASSAPVYAISAPVFDFTGLPIASITVNFGSDEALFEKRDEKIASSLRDLCQRVSRLLGHLDYAQAVVA